MRIMSFSSEMSSYKVTLLGQFLFVRYVKRSAVEMYLNRKYDVRSCLSQSEDINPGVLSVKTEFMKVYEGRVMKTDPRYLLVNLYQTIPKAWLWEMVVRHTLRWKFYSCILFQRAARGSRIFSNMADILTEVMHLYSTGGLTCN